MNYLRNRSLKRLMSMGRRSNPDEDCVVVDADSPTPPLPPPPASVCSSGRWMEQRSMSYLGSRSLKRLLSFGRRSNAYEEECGVVVDVDVEPQPAGKPTWRCFSYEEVDRATNGFHPDNVVGRGGYGEVYCGILGDGRAVAVKRLAASAAVAADEKKEKDFLTELGTVGHVRHPNVSSLLGCCVDRGLHLVFEFSTRGSVSANLHDEKRPAMTWAQRHGVAVGTARGLRYLHKGCARRIIHRDIKASNILLDADYEPQISDFGLARWLPSEWTHHAIAPIEGTFGCLAPEYFTHGIVDEKTDVFAFGVFLLELISGRKPVDGSHMSLLAWARPYLNDGVVQGLVDPRLGDGYDAGQLRRLMFVASLCARPAAAWRPTMTESLLVALVPVLNMEGTLEPENGHGKSRTPGTRTVTTGSRRAAAVHHDTTVAMRGTDLRAGGDESSALHRHQAPGAGGRMIRGRTPSAHPPPPPRRWARLPRLHRPPRAGDISPSPYCKNSKFCHCNVVCETAATECMTN